MLSNMNYEKQLPKEIVLAAIKIGEGYLELARIPGEEENRILYLGAVRNYLQVARASGFPTGLLFDGNPIDCKKE